MIDTSRSIFSKEELLSFFENELNQLLEAKRATRDVLEKRPILAQEAYVRNLVRLFSAENAERDRNIISLEMLLEREKRPRRPPRPARLQQASHPDIRETAPADRWTL